MNRNTTRHMSIPRKALSLLSAAILTASITAQDLSVKKVEEKYGYADESGTMVIKASYEHAYPFQGDRAKVCKDGKWGYIGKNGKAIIPIQYDNIEEFENGLARVSKGGKYGFIKEDGTVYIKPDFNFIGSFNEDGYIWVAKGKTLKEATKGLYRHDKEIIPPKVQYLGFYVKTDSADYTSGVPVSAKDGVPGNNEITQNFCRLSHSEYPYIWVTPIAGQNIIYDTDGKVVIKAQRGAIGMPRDGYSLKRAYSKSGNKQYYSYNYISADGKSSKLFKKDIKQLLDNDNIFESCLPFDNGIAMCGNESNAYLIDTSGNNVSSLYDKLQLVPGKGYITTYNNVSGLITLDGKEIVEPKYTKLLAPFGDGGILPAQEPATGRFGFIDFSGKQAVPFRFEDAIAFSDGKAYIKENGYYGIVDTDGNYIVRNRWEAILPPDHPESGLTWGQSPETKKWHAIRISDDTLAFEQGYDAAGTFDPKGRAIIRTGDLFGAVGADGSTILPTCFNDEATAHAAIGYIDAEGKTVMAEIDAYRFNIYNSPARHKYRLHETVATNMWDF